MKGIEGIIFDVGGVMLKTHDHSHRHAWDKRLNLPLNTVEETVFNSELGIAAQHGRVSTEAHWDAIGAHFSLTPADQAQMRQDFWAGDEFDYRLIDWIRSELRPRYKLGIISNAFDDLRVVLTEEFKVADLFDTIVISSEEGMMKPKAAIYEAAIDRLGLSASSQAIFIDDSQKNIDGAAAIGMPGVLFTKGFDLPAAWPGIIAR